MAPKTIDIEHPMRVAELLERRFGVVTKKAQELALKLLVPAIRSGEAVRIQAALNEIEARLNDVSDSALEDAARDAAEKVERNNHRLFYGMLGAAIGAKIIGNDGAATTPGIPDGKVAVPAGALARGGSRGIIIARVSAEPSILAHEFATENARMIKSLRAEVIPALRDEVVRAVRNGWDPDVSAERLAKKWRKKGVPVANGNLKPQVRSIVRDQVAKLNTSLTRARAEAAGVEEFVWRSRRDSRVRPLHRTLDGERFPWATGHPTEGLPGQPPLCRCRAIPVVDRETVLASGGFVELAKAEAVFEIPA